VLVWVYRDKKLSVDAVRFSCAAWCSSIGLQAVSRPQGLAPSFLPPVGLTAPSSAPLANRPRLWVESGRASMPPAPPPPEVRALHTVCPSWARKATGNSSSKGSTGGRRRAMVWSSFWPLHLCLPAPRTCASYQFNSVINALHRVQPIVGAVVVALSGRRPGTWGTATAALPRRAAAALWSCRGLPSGGRKLPLPMMIFKSWRKAAQVQLPAIPLRRDSPAALWCWRKWRNPLAHDQRVIRVLPIE
jgi:hypothetical protein